MEFGLEGVGSRGRESTYVVPLRLVRQRIQRPQLGMLWPRHLVEGSVKLVESTSGVSGDADRMLNPALHPEAIEVEGQFVSVPWSMAAERLDEPLPLSGGVCRKERHRPLQLRLPPFAALARDAHVVGFWA
jgi:hypothetical protein